MPLLALLIRKDAASCGVFYCPMPTENRSYAAFLEALAGRESSGRYDAVNSYGYLGKYQLGKAALIDCLQKDIASRWPAVGVHG